MTKYEELWGSFIHGEGKFTQDLEATWAFAGKLGRRLIEYLECPADRVFLFSTKKGPSEKVTVPGAVELHPEGFWTVGLAVRIASSEEDRPGTMTIRPETTFFMQLQFGKNDDVYTFHMGNNKTITIAANSNEDMEAFHKVLFEFLNAAAKASRGTGSSQPYKQIGF